MAVTQATSLANFTSGIGTIISLDNVDYQIGIGTTNPSVALDVIGDARITGILTVGSSSLTLDGTNNVVNVGTALTLGHTQGLYFIVKIYMQQDLKLIILMPLVLLLQHHLVVTDLILRELMPPH